MFEKYKQQNGAYDFTPQNGKSASEFAIERIEHCSPDIRRNCLDKIVYELCNIYYDEWRAYNPKLRPVHKKVGGEWVRVDPPTAASEANDRHLENYNNALALLCSVVYDAGRIYGIRCTAKLIRHMEWQGFNKVVPFFEETLKGADSLARNNERGGALDEAEGKRHDFKNVVQPIKGKSAEDIIKRQVFVKTKSL